jgi:2-polyprenyl-3-methyl-5-hydroxy-6-metoxy-1,4-benzoquinol methylase
MGNIIHSVTNKNVLDVGCGDGIIGYEFASRYNLVPQYTDVTNTIAIPNATVHIFDPDQPLVGSDTFGIITCFHILHHIPTLFALQFRLKDIHSRIAVGGYLLIREHDANSDIMKKKIAWQHIVYEIREIRPNMSQDELIKWILDYKLSLYSKENMSKIIEDCGYTYVNSSKPTAFDGSYYGLFKKL